MPSDSGRHSQYASAAVLGPSVNNRWHQQINSRQPVGKGRWKTGHCCFFLWLPLSKKHGPASELVWCQVMLLWRGHLNVGVSISAHNAVSHCCRTQTWNDTVHHALVTNDFIVIISCSQPTSFSCPGIWRFSNNFWASFKAAFFLITRDFDSSQPSPSIHTHTHFLSNR